MTAPGEARALKPCPFCGGAARFAINTEIDSPHPGGEWIECSSCGCCTTVRFPLKEDVKQHLREDWSRRESILAAAVKGGR